MAGTIISAVAAPLIGGAVSSIFGGGKSSGGGSQPSAPGPGSTGSAGAERAAALADPFASQRPQYQQQLSDLMSGKTPYEQTAGAQFAEQQGIDAVTAHNRSTGHANSGNEEMDIAKYATGVAGQGYQQQMSNLMTLSGATTGAPGAAGGFVAGQSTSDTNALNTFGSTVGNAVMGSDTVKGWMGGPMQDMTGFSTPAAAAPWVGSSAGGGGGGGALGSGTYDLGSSGSDLGALFTF